MEEKLYEDSIQDVVLDAEEFGNFVDKPNLIPPTKAVTLVVKKAELRESKEGGYNYIALGYQLRDGIGTEGKYRGAYLWKNVPYKVDTSKYTSEYFTSGAYKKVYARLFVGVKKADAAGNVIGEIAPPFAVSEPLKPSSVVREIVDQTVVADIGTNKAGDDNTVINERPLQATMDI